MKVHVLYFSFVSLVFFTQASEKKISSLILKNQNKIFKLEEEQEEILKSFEREISYKIKNAHTLQEKNNIREVYGEMNDIIVQTYEMWKFSVYENTAHKIYKLHKHNEKSLS